MITASRENYCLPKNIKVKQIDKPSPNEDEVLIRVHATTVNRTDCANLTAKPFLMRFVIGFLKPKKTILGTDFAGQIVAVGKDISSLKLKDRVFGFTDLGLETQAEYIALKPKNNVLIIPENVDYKNAAASLEGAHYAYSFIHKVNLRPGQKILINGATGGIGSALIQFAKQHKVFIAATCNTQNIELIKSLGADKVYDYLTEDFTKDNQQYDYVFDAVGKSTFNKCKPILKKNGIYISSELGPYAQNLFYSIFTPILGKRKVIFPVPYSIKQTLPFIKQELENGHFNPVIDKEYSLSNISEAYSYVMKGEKIGNVIVQISN